MAVPSAVVLVLLVVVAVFASQIAPYDPYSFIAADQLTGPSAKHLMGTDQYGRDVFSRVVFGSRLSLMVGVVSVGLSTIFGTAIGLVSGYWSGRPVDHVLQRVMDSMMAIPGLILAIAIMTIMGVGIAQVIVAIAILGIPLSSRVVRGTVVSSKANQYVESARAIGAREWRILLVHIFPNVFAPIIILASLGLGGAITTEASLSFLGFGAPPEEPSWGGMLSKDARSYIESGPWLAIFPGFAISSVVLAFNLFGDALRDILDPRLRR